MKRTALVVLLMVTAAMVVTAAPAGALGASSAAALSASDVAADFNNDGVADLAVGVPGENSNAGAVNVLYGAGGGLSGTGAQVFTQVGGTPEVGDSFGWELAAGDFDNDGFADLAVGAPFEGVGAAGGAGAVSILYGSAGGLTTAGGQLFIQLGGAEAGAEFGFALAAGDFDNDGFADLAAGAPFDDNAAHISAGAVMVLPGSADGLTAIGGLFFSQVGGAVENADLFGWALVAGDFDNDGFSDLASGAPGETVGSSAGSAGAVSVLSGSAAGLTTVGGRLFTQVGGNPEGLDEFGWELAAGDFDNDGFADLAAGAPFEAVGRARGAGAVSVLYGSAGGVTAVGGRLFTQVGGAVEAGDLFGFALAAGDFNANGSDDLAAGAPREQVGSLLHAGAVSVLPGSAAGLTATGGRLLTQVGGTVEVRDQFGAQLATGDFDDNGAADLAAAAPTEAVGSIFEAGAVSVVNGSGGGLAGGRLFTQNSPGVPGTAEFLDHFGGAVPPEAG